MLADIQSHLLVLMAGYVFSMFLGIPLRFFFGLPLRRKLNRRIHILGQKLNQRSIATRVWRGLIVVVLLLIPCFITDWMLGSGFFAGIIIALSADIQPALWHGWAAVSAAKHQDEPRLTLAASKLALEPQTAPDHHGMLRLIILSLTHHFSILLVGGAFWFALLGLKGLLSYYVLAMASHYFHDTQEDWKAFGWAATRLFMLVDIVPSILACVLLLAASILVPKARPLAGLKAYMSVTHEHHAHLVAATLGVGLGGPRIVNGAVVKTPWIGQGSAKVEANTMARFMTLFSIGLFGFILFILFIIGL